MPQYAQSIIRGQTNILLCVPLSLLTTKSVNLVVASDWSLCVTAIAHILL